MAEITHIDEWLDTPKMPSDPACYAGFVMDYFRYPAWKKYAYAPFMKDHKLFCTWQGGRYRVTGCSRLGDVWLAEDHARESGYDHRVDIADCSNWGPTA